MVKGRVRWPVDQGLLIIEDPESSFGHDEWDPAAEFVSAGDDSLHLSVRPSEDGPVDLVIATSDPGEAGVDAVYFDGTMRFPSKQAVIRDAGEVMRFAVRCPQGQSRVRVLVDHPGLAARMVVIFSD